MTGWCWRFLFPSDLTFHNVHYRAGDRAALGAWWPLALQAAGAECVPLVWGAVPAQI